MFLKGGTIELYLLDIHWEISWWDISGGCICSEGWLESGDGLWSQSPDSLLLQAPPSSFSPHLHISPSSNSLNSSNMRRCFVSPSDSILQNPHLQILQLKNLYHIPKQIQPTVEKNNGLFFINFSLSNICMKCQK